MKEQLLNLARDKGFNSIFSVGIHVNELGWLFWLVELQKWLREVYNIHIVISVDFYKDGINYLWQVFKYDVTKKYNCEGTGIYGDNGEYPIYEQCLEAAIQESLKLIK